MPSGLLSQVRLCLRERVRTHTHARTHSCTHAHGKPPSRLMRPLGEWRAGGRETEMSRGRRERMGNEDRRGNCSEDGELEH